MSEQQPIPLPGSKTVPPASKIVHSTPLPRVSPPPVASPNKVVPSMTHVPTADELAPIGLIDELEDTPSNKKIQAFGIQGAAQQHNWKRKANLTGSGAIRVRSFHGKLSDQGLGFMDDSINEWLDQHPEIEIKFVTTTTGVFEGKMREPAVILNLWY